MTPIDREMSAPPCQCSYLHVGYCDETCPPDRSHDHWCSQYRVETWEVGTPARLSWACGPESREGWHHSDLSAWPGMERGRDHFGPIQHGLPWADGTFDYVVSHHGLMMLPEVDLVPALVELRRVTTSGGWLRVSVPDMLGAIAALRRADRGWFPVEADSPEQAFCLYVTQGGATRSVFTRYRLVRLLVDAGWSPNECAFGLTKSPHPEITELDSRPNESLFMEAVKPGG